MGKLLTTEEAAVALATPVNTLRYWIQQKTGPKSLKVGRRRLYSEEALAEFLADKEREELERISASA